MREGTPAVGEPLPPPDPDLCGIVATHYGKAAIRGQFDRVEIDGSHRALYAAAARLGSLWAGNEIGASSGELIISRLALRGARGRRITRREAERIVRDGWEKGSLAPAKAPTDGRLLRDRPEATEKILAWWSGVLADPPTGTTAGTTMRILSAFYAIALKAGKVRIGASTRQIAENAGVSPGTVIKHRMHWDRFVRCSQPGSRRTGNAGVWQLVVRDGQDVSPAVADGNRPEASAPSLTLGLFPSATRLRNPAHDRWLSRPNDHRVYMLLLDAGDDGMTAADMLAETGLKNRSTVWRILKRLADEREPGGVLVHDDGDGRWTAREADADASHFLYADERRQRHEAERANYKAYRAARDEEQASGKATKARPRAADGSPIDADTGEVLDRRDAHRRREAERLDSARPRHLPTGSRDDADCQADPDLAVDAGDYAIPA